MTQEELGKAIGMTQYRISLYETGKMFPGDAIRERIERVLGARIDWFSNGSVSLSRVGGNTMRRTLLDITTMPREERQMILEALQTLEND